MSKPYIVTCLKCKKKFCSSDPHAKFHQSCKPAKKKYPYSKLFAKRRIDVLIRDNQTCQHCGFDFKTGGKSHDIHIVHIEGRRNNSLNNLVTLCNTCHRKSLKEKLDFKIKKNFKIKEYPEYLPDTKRFLFKGIDG